MVQSIVDFALTNFPKLVFTRFLSNSFLVSIEFRKCLIPSSSCANDVSLCTWVNNAIASNALEVI